MHILLDIRYAFRQFARRPGTTLAIVFVLTVGMTVAASLFSFIRAYNTAPPPGIAPAEDLVWIRGLRSTPYDGLLGREFSREELRAQAQATSTFRAVAGWTDGLVAIERPGADQADWITATFVTDGYFEVLDVRPTAGPGLPSGASASNDPLVAVIARGLRERHFATDDAAIGATLSVSGRAVRVVGVAPAGFRGMGFYEPNGLWLPEAALPYLVAKEGAPRFSAFARLAPGVSLATASEAMQAIAAHATQEDAAVDERDVRSTDVVPMAAMRGDPLFEAEARGMMTGITLLAVLVLLVTGMNASALQTGIAMTRGREVATRLSLGASRWRVLRQMLVESGLLGVLAGGVAIGLLVGVGYLLRGVLSQAPFPLAIDPGTAALAIAVALGAGVLAGLSPALYATRGDIVSGLKAGGGAASTRRGTLQRALVFVQVLLTQ
ncbi:MAG TPA: ABC transporter permease, partial [Xanthomonadales bacterium]|nr:ABC transporter permease [Xanthomonadales bacterium]